MLENPQFAVEYGASCGLAPAYVATEIEKLHLAARIAEVNREARRRRQAQFYRWAVTFWPVAVGVVMAFYAPMLQDLAARFAPWATTLLFPLSALAADRGMHFTWATAQAVSQFMLFAQFPLDGVLARLVLKPRPTLFSVCGQVICMHAIPLLFLALVNGSLSQLMMN